MVQRLATLVLCSAAVGTPLLAAGLVSQYAEVDGRKIHFLNQGDGDEALVFLHGWTCDATFWSKQAPVYQTRRSILIDLPGHGKSDKAEIPYSMDLFARAVNAVMEHAKVKRATIVGHSMGTAVSIQFLRLYPEKVAGIAIVDGFVPQPPKSDGEREQQKERAAAIVKIYRAADYKASAQKMIESMFTKDTDSALKHEIEVKMLATPQHVMAGAMEGMMAMQPLTERFPGLPVAAMMMKRPNSAAYAEFLSQRFRLTAFEEYDDAGHFLMMERPDRFNRDLVAFLDRIKRKQ